ncbi:recombinase family protein, partial [Klebsiella pneumoniae]|nr:recombinase family protein [Klebsiella pneumoniae]
ILGRPVATETRRRVQEAREQGLSQSKAAQSLGLGIATIKRYWNI